MAITANVRVTLDTKKLDEYARNIGRTADRAVQAVAMQGVNEVKIEIVAKDIIDTGALLNSIEAEKLAERLWMVRDGVHYGIYQEFGTYRMGARPFMLPGVLRATKDFASAVSEWCFDEVAT